MERYLWMRLGASLRITEAEEVIIFSGDAEAENVLRKIIAEGRFLPEGDTYIPESEVVSYNERYGTEYEAGDTEFNL